MARSGTTGLYGLFLRTTGHLPYLLSMSVCPFSRCWARPFSAPFYVTFVCLFLFCCCITVKSYGHVGTVTYDFMGLLLGNGPTSR